VSVLSDLSLDIARGEFVALMGPSDRASRRCST
jgi:ABC-type Fe3+/spermidine/putrescine transport system ATPase subunit